MGGYENLGPIISQNPQAVTPGGGSYSADERSYDSVVFQQNHPPMDWEMNLIQSVVGNAGLRNLASKLFSSTFISGNVLESNAPGAFYEFLPAVAGNENIIRFSACDLLVNGWALRLEYSNTDVDGKNLVQLTAPPLTGIRQDLLILEVWRALLSPLPSVDNKSLGGLILRNGNANAPDTVNLSDDLIDPNYLAETSRRVQIQYRIRIIESVDILSYPDGLGDPSITAHTVPYLGGSDVNGNDLPAYVYTAVAGDSGLWRSGAGDAASATDIGSVDGYICSLPLCVVVRRNSDTWDKTTNLNGGVLIGGVSPRPDGLFSDQIASGDLIDLRKYTAWNAQEFKNDAVDALMQNSLSTQYEESALGTGGNTFLMKDPIGTSSHIWDADGVRTSYSDKPVVHPIALSFTIPMATNTLTCDLTINVDLPWASGINILANAPAGTNLLSISKCFINDGVGNIYDAFDSSVAYHILNIVYSISGTEIDTATIEFNQNIPVGTVFLEALVEYPPNVGLSRNVISIDKVWVPNNFDAWVDTSEFTATSDADRSSINTSFNIDLVNRQVTFAYPSNLISDTFYNHTLSQFMIPDCVDASSVVITGKAVVGIEYNAGCTVIEFNPPEMALGVGLAVDYVAYRPPVPLGMVPYDSIDVFYQTRSIQSIPVPVGMYSPSFYRRTDIERVFFISSGSGSYDSAEYDASTQLAIPRLPIVDYSDSLFSGYHESSVVTNGNDNGISEVLVTEKSYLASDGFYLSTAGGTTQDADGRNYWPYSPNIILKAFNATDFNISTRRKLASDFVLELKEDFPSLGRKGSLYLAMATGYSYNSRINKIHTSDSVELDGVSLFRLRGNPLYYRRSS